MPIDPRIALGFVPPQIDDPLTVQTKQLQLSDLMGRQQAQQMQFQQAQREQSDQRTLADLYRTAGSDPTKLIQGMAERGLGARIPAFQKQQADTGKINAEAEAKKFELAKHKLDVTGRTISSIASNPNATHDDVIRGIQGLVQAGALTPQEGAAEVSQLPSRPEMLRGYLIQKGLEVADASKRLELLLPKSDVRNMGGSDQAFKTNLLTGQVTAGPSFGKTATPGEVLTDQRTRAEGAADRGVQIRGQDVSAATAAAGRVPAGYRLKADGSLEAIPGGPADQKAGSPAQKIQDATEAIQLINQAEPLLKGSTGSYSGLAIDKLAQAFGVATPGAINAQQLKAIEGALVSKMPKMSGPQSDKDVALYRQMAAVIGDETIPYAQKAAALEQVREIQERYAGMVPGSSRPAPPPKPRTEGWDIRRVN